MARKKRGFGTVDQLPSGKWRARYTGPDGQQHKGPQTWFDEGDALSWIRDEQKLIEFDEWSPPATRMTRREDLARTVGSWILEWLDLRSRGTNPLAQSTLDDYRRTLDARVLKVTGRAARLRDIPLLKVTRRDVATWWDDINRQFDSPPYNRNAYARLRTAIQAAVDRDIIPGNVVSVPDAKSRPKPKRKQLPDGEIMQAIVDQLDHTVPRVDGRHKLIAILTFFHGMRIGEALGLRREHIIDTGDTISIRVTGNAYRRPGKGMALKDTAKTDAGTRTVPVFPHFHNDLRYHLDHFTPPHPTAQLFLSAHGQLILDTSYRSILHRAKIRAGMEDVEITPHYGRVWLITTLAELGMVPPAIGEILGQVDLKTITEIYMRSTEAKRNEILGQVNAALTSSPVEVGDLDKKRAEKRKTSSGEAAG
ncbi:site-specific recombinase, phage integrase family [Corynebacterium efficiens YS-314]|uniref:Putative integrase n=1 Tax=Corynebacterium efficiens (strain DSM 44549 / YS-314 / AJ 12310 / JCM 11189 / NBRC 100395) TaxID=196164 RepID=Q8FRE5_COREF|nr:site-specific integrase [Corynebacterium efficiens]EEW50463.1 site-specific recombinase, phage integrase family [Corynebacterium efficiens YS-314]BAC17626.1 putative integrase [Corynebacterium efficiens YS-314]